MQSTGNWWTVIVDPAASTITLVRPGDSLTDINHEFAIVSITPKA